VNQFGPQEGADLPSKTEAPVFQPPPPEFDWTGFYAGIHVGGGIDHFAFPYSIDVPGNWGYTQGSNGITAGGPLGQAGYNYALPFFHIVAGVEIEDRQGGEA
jgi:outer membrane immunogenic protein